MKSLKIFVFIVSAVLAFFPLLASAASVAPHDATALDGLKVGKAVYDVRTKEPKRLLFSLKVIEQTEKGIIGQGVKTDFVISFRGGTLPLLTSEPKVDNEADKAILKEVRERLGQMRSRGMVLEACNVAAGIFKVKEQELSEEVTLIGNSLISLIGYQNKGYALVPMY